VNTEKKNHKAQDHVWYVHIHANLHVCVCVYMRVQISITLCVCLERRSIVRAMMTDDKGFFVHPPPLSYEMCTFVDIFLYMWEHNFSLVTPSTQHGPLTKKYDEIRLPDTLQLGDDIDYADGDADKNSIIPVHARQVTGKITSSFFLGGRQIG